MKTAAIICEYNPFHNGHKFHIEETRKKTGADAIIALMSGNFVQRGDVAVYPKELRAKLAVENGADLVLELPACYSSASAELFASGAVKILDALGSVDFLSFGAESDDLASIMEISSFLANETDEFSKKLKEYTSKGISFPSARANATGDFLGASAKEVLSSPNNLLGIEYCKALALLKSSITPVLIKRTGASHDSAEPLSDTASASYIRELILGGNFLEASHYIPSAAVEILKNEAPHSLKALEKTVFFHLARISAEELAKIADVSEGLENRIKAAALSATSLEELVDHIKTKRYTHSRIRRIVLSALLGLTDADRKADPCYIKILAHNETGKKLIADAKKKATLPIVRNTSQINKLGNSEIKDAWERERIFDSIYNLT